MKKHRIELDELNLAVRELGSGPPIAFGHSLTFDHSMWLGLAEQMAKQYRVFLFDLPGHGDSSAPDREFALEDMADWCAAGLSALGVERTTWVGHSMGGMIGMRLALQHPDRVSALGLFNTTAQEQPSGTRELFHQVNEDSRGKPSSPVTVDFVLSMMFSPAFAAAHPDVVAPFRAQLFEPPDSETVYRAAHAVIWRADILQAVSAITAPTLVLTGADDSAVPASFGRRIAAAIPGARHEHLDACGHLSPVERLPEVTAVLQAFLSEVLR